MSADDKVVSLFGTAPGHPVPDVVRTLEELLERAKVGDVRAFAYANVRLDGTVGTGWALPDNSPGTATVAFENHALGSAILTLSVRYAGAVMLGDDSK